MAVQRRIDTRFSDQFIVEPEILVLRAGDCMAHHPVGCVVAGMHPHEQAGMLLEGRLELAIGEDVRLCEPGDLFIIPPNTPHRAKPVGGRAVVLDVFSPVREDYAKLFNRYIPSGH